MLDFTNVTEVHEKFTLSYTRYLLNTEIAVDLHLPRLK